MKFYRLAPGFPTKSGSLLPTKRGRELPTLTPVQKQEIEECHRTLSEALGKPERRLVLQIIDAKDRIAEDTSIDSFIAGFELAWKLSIELNHYKNERSVSCRTAMGLGARFASKEAEK